MTVEVVENALKSRMNEKESKDTILDTKKGDIEIIRSVAGFEGLGFTPLPRRGVSDVDEFSISQESSSLSHMSAS